MLRRLSICWDGLFSAGISVLCKKNFLAAFFLPNAWKFLLHRFFLLPEVPFDYMHKRKEEHKTTEVPFEKMPLKGSSTCKEQNTDAADLSSI